MQVKKLILSGLVSAAFLPVLATDWYYVGGSNEWWKAESYSTTKSKTGNTTMPSGTDCIYPTSATQKLYMDDSTVAFLNTIGGVYLNVNGVEFYLNLTTNATVTGYLGDIGGHGYYKNWLIKDGAGTLSFDGMSGTDPNKGLYGNSPNMDTYRCAISFDVRAGGVRLEPKRPDVLRSYHGSVKIAENAVFYNINGTSGQTYFKGSLSGAGTFTNENTGASSPSVYIDGGAADTPTEFSGVVSGKMTVNVLHSTYFTGVNNTTTIKPGGYTEGSVNRGFVGIKTYAGSFAGKGFSTKDNAGSLLFLNEEDDYVDFDEFSVYNSPFALDAGARGGVTISPKNWWGLANQSAVQQRLILQGSNTLAAVYNGPICNKSGNPSFFVTKRGTGVWRFDNETKGELQNQDITGLRGVFAVDEGTLEAVSLAEAGQRCSLGYADQLYEDKRDAVANLQTVSYAIRLGSPTTGEGTLSYIGTAAKEITTRQIAVQGKGRLKAPNAPYLNWVGVTGLDSGTENVMTFECAAGQTNVVTDLSGNLSVVKDGPGELLLREDVAFTGGLVVKQGKATLVNLNNAPYEWFKVTVKETAAASTNELYKNLKITTGTSWSGRYSRRFEIEEFGLYDSKGSRVNAYQNTWTGTETTPDWTVETLQPGQIAGAPTGLVTAFSNGFNAYAWYAADNVVSYGGDIKYRGASYHWNDGNEYAQYDKPETWMSLVQRLKGEDVGKVSFLDICICSMQMWTPTALEVFGSADGEHWDSLFATNNVEIAKDRIWLSGSANVNVTHPENTSHPKFALPRTTQKPLFDFANPSSISVADGATLKLEGSAVPVSKLVVAASGAGTVEGPFAFAATGTVDIPDLPNVRYVEIPAGTFVGCTGVENLANWTLTSNGQPVRRTFAYRDGKFIITKFGLSIIVR